MLEFSEHFHYIFNHSGWNDNYKTQLMQMSLTNVLNAIPNSIKKNQARNFKMKSLAR